MRVIDQDTGREFYLFNSEELKEETKAHWDQVCGHARLVLAQVKYRNGSSHVRKVCLDCGEFRGDTLRRSQEHATLPVVDQAAIRNGYHAKRRELYEQIVQKHVRIQRKRDAGFQKEYINYLSSPKWKQIREKVLTRANRICEGCLDKPASVIHHLNYKSIYSEMLFDLVALCRDCHEKCHPDKVELTDEEFFADDLPCYGCRFHGETNEGSWCDKFDVHTVIALVDKELCGPRAQELEPLK